MIELDSEQKKEIAVRLETVGNKILFAARDELYLGMRFLDVALSSFLYQMDITVNPFGTKLVGLSIVRAIHIKIKMIKIPKISFFRILFIRDGLSSLFSTLSVLL